MSLGPGETIIDQALVPCDRQLVSHQASYITKRCKTDGLISLLE
jgi:hypothetical protein